MEARALILLALVAIAHAYERPVNGDCVADGLAGVSLFPQEYVLPGGQLVDGGAYIQVEDAVGFSVQYHNNYKVVNNSIAGEVYVLYQCGTAAPAADSLPEGAKLFQIPLVSISVPETVPYAAMALLNLTDRVHSVPEYVVSPCGQALLACANDTREAPDAMSLGDTEALEEGVGAVIDGLLATLPYSYPKSIAFSASMDPGLLQRAEWVKFLGLFFNREREASQLFDQTQAEYERLKAAAAKEYADPGTPNPKVAWVSHFAYDGAEEYQISWAPYKAELAEGAGADMLSQEEVAAIPGVLPNTYDPDYTLTFGWASNDSFPDKQAAVSSFLAIISQVDVLIDETFSFDPYSYDVAAFLKEYGLSEEQVQEQPWYRNKRVYREDGLLSAPQDGNPPGMDWFESAVLRPADLLTDMVRAARPEIAEDPSRFIWLRNLFSEAPVLLSPSDCKAPISCTTPPVPICPFVSPCPSDNPAFETQPALLKGTDSGACIYEKCVAAT